MTSVTKNDILVLLKQCAEIAFIQNIVEYFGYGKNISIPENSSEFTKAAFKLNQMILGRSSPDEINNYVKELKKVPLSYGEMRSFFG